MIKNVIIVLVILIFSIHPLFAQEYEENESSFIESLFFTFQYGGGTMFSFGAGLGFFDNIVRPELLIGYTPEGEYKDVSFNLKINARILRIAASKEFNILGTLGSSFTFYSTNYQVTSAIFIAEEMDFIDILLFKVVTLYCEQYLYFVPNKEGNMLFQMSIGLRIQPF